MEKDLHPRRMCGQTFLFNKRTGIRRFYSSSFLFFHLRTPPLPTALPVYTESIKDLTTGKLLVKYLLSYRNQN